MPNWCLNKIEITPHQGDNESFERFKDTLLISQNGEITFHFSQTLPLPEEEKNNWYDWQCKNWGTKWDTQDAECKLEEFSLHISCSTPWNPPLEWAKNIAKKFGVNITVDYDEPNESFGGHAVATPEGLNDECWDIIYNSEDEMDTSDDENVFVYNVDAEDNGRSAPAA